MLASSLTASRLIKIFTSPVKLIETSNRIYYHLPKIYFSKNQLKQISTKSRNNILINLHPPFDHMLSINQFTSSNFKVKKRFYIDSLLGKCNMNTNIWKVCIKQEKFQKLAKANFTSTELQKLYSENKYT